MGGGALGTLRAAALAAALVMALWLALLPAAAAQVSEQVTERGLANACPGGVPPAGFTDIEGNVHRTAIDCMSLYRITAGTSQSRFGPAGAVRRDQMASFLLRLLDIAGTVLPPEGDAPFPDVASGNVHAAAIGQLAALGVIDGFADGTFRPGAPVRRDQMTAFLNRAFAEVAGEPLLSRRQFFTDTAGNVHEDDINALAGARVALGPGDGTFGPGEPVRRDQMAAFVMRLVDVLAEEGLLFTSIHVVTLDGYLVVDDVDPAAIRFAQGDLHALGHAFLGLHSGTGRLCYEIAVLADGPFTGAMIQQAPMDATGPAVVHLDPPDAQTGTAEGCVLVSTDLLRQIEADPTAFAIDVRSNDFPRGAVRGQVGTTHRAVSPTGAFVADDSGEAVRFGRGQTGATGLAVLQVDVAGGRLCAYLATDAPGPFLGAHLHQGAMDATGPDVLDLPVPADTTGVGQGCVDADPDLLADIEADAAAYYLSVRTRDHPAGAVRSQLSTGTLGIPLSGEYVIGEEGQLGHGQPGATGTAWLQADFATGFTCYWLTTNATGPFVGSHIIRAAAGENGPALVDFPNPDQTGELSACLQIDPHVLAETAHVERFAFLIRTEAFPQGAVRGQFVDGLLF